MLSLKKQVIELQIESPSELITKLKEFRKLCEEYNQPKIAQDIVDNKDDSGEIRSFYELSGIKYIISWKPKYKNYILTNL